MALQQLEMRRLQKAGRTRHRDDGA